jgi:hypothetical protein
VNDRFTDLIALLFVIVSVAICAVALLNLVFLLEWLLT